MEFVPKKPMKGTPENANSERGFYVGKFTDRLNQTRGNYPKLGYPRIGKALSHLTLQDLYYFWKRCEESDNFGRCFWGMLKVPKDPKTCTHSRAIDSTYESARKQGIYKYCLDCRSGLRNGVAVPN